MQTFENLTSFAPFNQLTEADALTLQEIATLKTFQAKEIILYEGDSTDSLYFLLDGAVKLYKVSRFENEIILGILESGLLTDFPLNDDCMSFATLECTKDSKIACFNTKTLLEITETHPKILALFFQSMQRKFKLFKEVIQRELVFDSTAKVTHTLFYQLELFNMRKKQENAALLNIQPETLSRILKKLHRDMILTTDAQGKIQILDAQKLKKYFK